MFEVEQYCWRL